MSQPIDEKDTSKTAINDNEQATFSANPLAIRPTEQIDNPEKHKPQIPDYQPDPFEALPFRQKVALGGLITLAFVLVSFYSGWIIGNPVEFFVGCLLTSSLFTVALCQYYVYKRQAHAMLEQRDVMERQLEYAQKAFEMVERPIVVVKFATFRGNKYPRLEPEITIENKGRTAAYNIRMKFGVAQEPLFPSEFGDRFEDRYPGHASDVWCERMFLASDGVEVLWYGEADTVTVEQYPGESWSPDLIVYGCGVYEGMGNEYQIQKFAFRVVNSERTRYALERDDRLAYKWANQEQNNQNANQGV